MTRAGVSVRDEAVGRAEALLIGLLPPGALYPGTAIPLCADESRWFVHGGESGIFRFQECSRLCPRLKRWRVAGLDEFLNPKGEPRHLYSFPPAQPRLNREYVPHIAAHSRAVLELGYRDSRASFSEYRQFGRDLLRKRKGGSFELDSLFCSSDGSPYLHIEVKTAPRAVQAMANAIDRFGELSEMPATVAKEIEYVLELQPQYFWLVGPGTVDPERHVWRVGIAGLTATFEAVGKVPSPK